jgi:hypothetical protein
VPPAKIGWFMSDNAKNNDTAVDFALQELLPNLNASQRKGRRLRCFGHTCNLIARAVLLGKAAGKQLSEIERKTQKGAFVAVDKAWRKFGGLGRLHNLIRYIKASTARREEFGAVKGSEGWAEFDNLEVSNALYRLVRPDPSANFYTSQYLYVPNTNIIIAHYRQHNAIDLLL